jgi:HEAT repeat protein
LTVESTAATAGVPGGVGCHALPPRFNGQVRSRPVQRSARWLGRAQEGALTPAASWPWPLAVALALYISSAAVIVVSRLGYARRRQLIARVEQVAVEGHAPESRVRFVDPAAAWPAVGPRAVARAVHEERLSRPVVEAAAHAIVRAAGLEAVARAASRTGRRGRHWRRLAALRVLALARPSDALPLLEAALREEDVEVVAVAAAVLGSMHDPEAAEILVRGLESGCFPASRLATYLERMPLLLPDALRPLLRAPTPRVRYWAAVLGRRYRGLRWMEDELRRLAGDEVAVVRKAALQSLALLGAPGAAGLAAGALADEAWVVRAHAARALGQLGAVEHAPAVAELLGDREWWVRHAAKQALVQMGREAQPAVVNCLWHGDRFACNSAAEVLQDTGAFEQLLATTALGAAAGEAEALVRRACEVGGPRLVWSVVARLPVELQPRVLAVVASLGSWPEEAAS